MLEVTSVNCFYNTVRAVRNASLTASDGEIVGVVGLNGAGKSTLMKAIAGIVPSFGKILLNGDDITSLKTEQRVQKGLVLVPEGRHIFPQMTVLENLKASNRLTKSSFNEYLYKSYSLFPDLQSFSHKKAGTLSGGQQQMLAIARALVAQAQTLLLDEPTMGLSPAMTSQVFDTIYNMKKNFSGIVITGQEAQRIGEVCDRIYIMKTGTLSELTTASKQQIAQAVLGLE